MRGCGVGGEQLSVARLLKLSALISFCAALGSLLILLLVPDSPLDGLLASWMAWIEDIPTVYGAFLFGAVQFAIVLLILPATPFNLAAGFMFGMWTGSVVCIASTDLAAVVAFYLGRYLARGWVERQAANSPKFKALDLAVEQQGLYIITLVRLSPIFPFGLCNYCFGLTNVSFWKYWLGSTVGLMPYTVAYVYFGTLLRDIADIFSHDQQFASQPEEVVLIIVGCVATVLTVIVVGLITRRAITNAITLKEPLRVATDLTLIDELALPLPDIEEGGEGEEGEDYERGVLIDKDFADHPSRLYRYGREITV